MQFSAEKRVLPEFKNVALTEASKKIGVLWRALSEEEKSKYVSAASQNVKIPPTSASAFSSSSATDLEDDDVEDEDAEEEDEDSGASAQAPAPAQVAPATVPQPVS